MPGIRSHSPALRVFRTKPRRCAHHTYCTVACSSRATTSTILFSKPSSQLLENGRLFGSLQTRSSRAWSGAVLALRNKRSKTALRQPKDIEVASFGRRILEVGHDVDEAQGSGAVARV